MRSLDDLRAAFSLLEDAAPADVSAHYRLAPSGRRPPRARRLAPVAAAVSVAATAGLAVAITHHATHGHPVAAASSPASNRAMVQLSGDGYSVTFGIPASGELCPDPPVQASYNTGMSRLPSSASPGGFVQPCVRVKVGAAGDAMPDGGTDPVRVSVNGHSGVFGTDQPIDRHDEATFVPSLIWQVVPTRWAVLQGGSSVNQNQRSEVALGALVDATAASIVLDPPKQPAQSHQFPFSLGFIPGPVGAEWGTTGANLTVPVYDGVDIGVGSVDVADYRSLDHRTTLVTRLWGPGALAGDPPTPPPSSMRVTGHGYVASVGAGTIDLMTGPYHLRILYAGPKATREDLIHIARHIRLPADVSNHATWFSSGDLTP